MNNLDIIKIRKENNLTQKEFADKLKVHFRTVQKWESGETKIKPSIVMQIKNVFNVRENTLFNNRNMSGDDGKGVSIIDHYEEKEVFINKNGIKFFIYPDDSYEIEVIKVPFPAYATYLEAFNDEEKLHNEFSTIRLPVDKIGKGYYIGFEIKNDSMNGGGIYDTPSGAEVLAREVGRHLWKSGFHKSKYGFILMTKNAIYHKDIKCYDDECGMLTLTSRDGITEEFEVSINDVFRIFNVIKRSF